MLNYTNWETILLSFSSSSLEITDFLEINYLFTNLGDTAASVNGTISTSINFYERLNDLSFQSFPFFSIPYSFNLNEIVEDNYMFYLSNTTTLTVHDMRFFNSLVKGESETNLSISGSYLEIIDIKSGVEVKPIKLDIPEPSLIIGLVSMLLLSYLFPGKEKVISVVEWKRKQNEKK